MSFGCSKPTAGAVVVRTRIHRVNQRRIMTGKLRSASLRVFGTGVAATVIMGISAIAAEAAKLP
jgi:hypothetical protein